MKKHFAGGKHDISTVTYEKPLPALVSHLGCNWNICFRYLQYRSRPRLYWGLSRLDALDTTKFTDSSQFSVDTIMLPPYNHIHYILGQHLPGRSSFSDKKSRDECGLRCGGCMVRSLACLPKRFGDFGKNVLFRFPSCANFCESIYPTINFVLSFLDGI
jgi:hypothetical protein